MMHGHQGRQILLQHRSHCIYINRGAMQQGLLVEFSCNPHYQIVSRSLTVDFILFSLFTLFYFTFSFSFIFYFQNNSGQGLSVTLSHQSQIDGIATRLITGLGRMKQKVLEQSDIIQHGQHMLASCYTYGHLGQGAQQLAQTMGNSI